MSWPQTRCCLIYSLTALVVGSISAAQTLAGDGSVSNVASTADGELIVHEWGTFTSYSGSDGVRLEFRPLVDNDLPAFVFDWMKWTGADALTKRTIRARQRMETPVTYFYTDRLREVSVQVDFPDGVLTEFYPPVHRIEPQNPPRWGTAGIPAEQLRNGLLDWGRVTLIPESALRPNLDNGPLADALARRAFQALPPGSDPEPELYTGDHYYFARETDSALVHVNLSRENKPQAADGNWPFPFQPTGDYFEKFLFYRGVGNFELPLAVESRDDGRFGVLNRGQHPIAGLILVQVRDGDVRFSRLDDLPGGEGRVVSALPEYVAANGQHVGAALWHAMHAALLAEGLYEKEVNAMIKTWDSSWFREEGTRLLYVVPRELTDQILPLTVTPAPRETVRVLVGRMEILPASEEDRIEQVVSASARARQNYHAQRQAAQAAVVAAQEAGKATPEFAPLGAAPGVPEDIHSLGRFAEPALGRICEVADDPGVRQEARVLISLLRIAKEAAPGTN